MKLINKKENRKNIWRAVLLTFLCPGLGHLYVGKRLRGICFFSIILFSHSIAVTLSPIVALELYTINTPALALFSALIPMLCLTIVWVICIIDVKRLTHEYNDGAKKNENLE